MEGEFRCQRTRCDIVRAAEGGKEIVKRSLVRDIHACHLETPLVAIAIEEVVVSDRSVKEIPLPNARWIMVVIARARSRNPQQG